MFDSFLLKKEACLINFIGFPQKQNAFIFQQETLNVSFYRKTHENVMNNDNDNTILNARGCAHKTFKTELPKLIQKVVKIMKIRF